MKIKQLKLYTKFLKEEKSFYSEVLGLDIIEGKNSFFVQIGWTQLIFMEFAKKCIYHYCFLIPSNQIHEALNWIEKRTEIIKIDDHKKIQNFENWNADSLYFYDGSGNVVEFICHYDLDYIADDFDETKILGICEIGLPTYNIERTNKQLTKGLNTQFWKGDLEVFGTNGTAEGKFLLPNYQFKTSWYPTHLKVEPESFECIIENYENEYRIKHRDESLKIEQL